METGQQQCMITGREWPHTGAGFIGWHLTLGGIDHQIPFAIYHEDEEEWFICAAYFERLVAKVDRIIAANPDLA